MIEKTNNGKDLKKCLGILKNDKEYNEIMKEIKSYWNRWTRRYFK